MSRNQRPDADRPHRELYEVMADEDASLAHKRERILELGRDHLGGSVAIDAADGTTVTTHVVATDGPPEGSSPWNSRKPLGPGGR